MNDSLWKNTQELPQFPRLAGDAKTDILIIGGGMAGLLTAWKLHQAGADYLLIEAGQICGGVTGNTTAKITSQHGLIYDKLLSRFHADTARAYWEANQAALEEYRKLSRSIPCDLEPKDAYVYSTDNLEPLERELRALELLDIQAEYVSDLSLPIPTTGAVCFRNQAQFHPLKFAAGIAAGLNIREHTRALAFAGNTVVTNHGRITASRIVVATHFPMLNKHGSYFLKLYQDRSYVLALEHAADPGGMFLDNAKGGLSFRTQGDYLLLGGGGHRTGKQSSGWGPLEDFANVHYPSAREVFRWATQDCMTLDGIPYIGQYSARTPDLYVATGFGKWGMTSSMVAATLLTDLLQGKDSPYAEVFSPSRSILRPQLLVNGLEATKNLLTPTWPRCPHMGCALKWNPQEHSWDCPCHGSRFDKGGNLLENPANGSLKKK